MAKNKTARRNKIRLKIRSKIFGMENRPRLSIFRSNKDIYAQLIDDNKGITLLSVSSRSLTDKTTKVEKSAMVGKELAEKATAKGITSVVFDRSGYLYHGRVKSLAEAARQGGLIF